VSSLPVCQYCPGQLIAKPTTLEQLGKNRLEENSVTNFACLTLWVGKRRGLPVERSLAMLEARIRATQLSNGRWLYNPWVERPGDPAKELIGVDARTFFGLSGIALSLRINQGKSGVELAKDPHIAAGLRAAGPMIGGTTTRPADLIDRVA